jgi:hypothetical protein
VRDHGHRCCVLAPALQAGARGPRRLDPFDRRDYRGRMGSAARALLDQLERRDWFAHSGSPTVRPAVIAGSWAEAATSASSDAWTDVLIAAANVLAASTITTPARHARWNALVAQIKPRCAALVMTRMRGSPLTAWVGDAQLSPGPANDAERQAMIDRAIAVPATPGRGTLLLGNLEWIVLHAVIETELASQAGFFRRAVDWLLEGHLVCGWRGDLTSGVPLIY